jgi:hypothetical protein
VSILGPKPKNLPPIEADIENRLKNFEDFMTEFETEISNDCVFFTSFDISSDISAGLSFVRVEVCKRSTFL